MAMMSLQEVTDTLSNALHRAIYEIQALNREIEIKNEQIIRINDRLDVLEFNNDLFKEYKK